MNLDYIIRSQLSQAFVDLFNTQLAEEEVSIQPTRKEFEGSHTIVCFPYARYSKKSPEETGKLIGEFMQEHAEEIESFNVVKGFLNLTFSDNAWMQVFQAIQHAENYGYAPANGEEVMVEYSSPNTNKPLHLGHLRNNFLGWSVSEILKANGYKVHRVQIINDRGIHISKSMVAWSRYGKGATPESSGIKGDKLVGNFYVKFDQVYKEEMAALTAHGTTEEKAAQEAPIIQEAKAMLRKWEQKDPEVYALWEKMNQWVYDGFNATYKAMGVDFDKLYYESDTYLLGREEVRKGLDKGVFFQKEDGSVWVDLTDRGLDQKLLLRADGTSVYMTQDIGTAILRFNDFPNISRQIYTVGNEQEYHFKVLFLILEKLGYTWAKECFHLSYGMVDLPSGKMKSREGTVVDADDLMQEMVETAEAHTRELGKIDDFTEGQAQELYKVIGTGALKYFLLKVDPRKKMLFNPTESVQFQGNTGPFIQYTYARIAAISRKADQLGVPHEVDHSSLSLQPIERELIRLLNDYPDKVQEAGNEYSPSIVAQYVYDLAKEYNRFYQEVPIFGENDEMTMDFRVALSRVVAETIAMAMGLLGIKVPERM